MKRLPTLGRGLKTIMALSLLSLMACQAPVPISEQPTEAYVEPVVSTELSPGAEKAVTDPAADAAELSADAAPACDCPVVTAQACPQVVLQPVPVLNNQEKNFSVADKLLVGRVEHVTLLPQKIKLKAKIDTGAKTSSLHAMHLTEFERDGKNWVRFAMLNPDTEKPIFFERAVLRRTKVKQQDTDLQHRPTVKMTIMLGPMEEQVEFTLADRSGYLYQVLIGRNVLRDRFIVDVSQIYLTGSSE